MRLVTYFFWSLVLLTAGGVLVFALRRFILIAWRAGGVWRAKRGLDKARRDYWKSLHSYRTP